MSRPGRHTRRAHCLLALSLVGLTLYSPNAQQARAADPDRQQESASDLTELSLEELLNVKVTSSPNKPNRSHRQQLRFLY